MYPQNVAILAIRKNKYPQNFCNKRRIFDDESIFILLFYYQVYYMCGSDKVLTFRCFFTSFALFFSANKKIIIN